MKQDNFIDLLIEKGWQFTPNKELLSDEINNFAKEPIAKYH